MHTAEGEQQDGGSEAFKNAKESVKIFFLPVSFNHQPLIIGVVCLCTEC